MNAHDRPLPYILRPFILAIILLALALVVPRLLFNGKPYVSLEKTSVLAGEASQAIGVDNQGKLQYINKDFVLRSTTYLDSDRWVVTVIHNLKGKGDAYLVLQKQNGSYVPFLGPGTAFDRSYMSGVSDTVTNYLDSKGVLYAS